MNQYSGFLIILLAQTSLAAPCDVVEDTSVTDKPRPIELNRRSDGKGKCLEATYGQLHDGAECFEYYQKGPCASNEVIAYNSLSGFGECVPDLCLKENNEKSKDKKTFAPLDDDEGKCLELGSKGCKEDSEESLFMIEAKSRAPVCIEGPETSESKLKSVPEKNDDNRLIINKPLEKNEDKIQIKNKPIEI